MGIRDSRHTVDLPRWGIETGETESTHVVAPPTQKRDEGWVPGVDVPVPEWFNWLAQKAYLFLAYIESFIGKSWVVNHLMRIQKGTSAGEVTAGAGLSVNVATGFDWIQGAMYEVPAATNLALAAADPTNPRFDLVVSRLSGGVPAYVVKTGTPAASPVEPAAASNEVAHAGVRVNAAAVTPSQITDRRIFGSVAHDEAQVDRTLKAGDLGGGNFLLEVDDDVVVGGRVKIAPVAGLVDIGNGLLSFLPGAAQVIFSAATTLLRFPAAAAEFSTPITRTYDISVYDFQLGDGLNADIAAATVETDLVSNDPSGGTGVGIVNDTALGTGPECVRAGVRIPKGATITAVRIYGNRATNTPGLQFTLTAHKKVTGVSASVANDANNGSGPTGDFTLEVSGLSHAVDGSETFRLLITWVGAGEVGLHGAEVEYTLPKPWPA